MNENKTNLCWPLAFAKYCIRKEVISVILSFLLNCDEKTRLINVHYLLVQFVYCTITDQMFIDLSNKNVVVP